MNAELNSTYRYQIGGSLPPDSPTYVVRQADSDLFNALLGGEYCYVLNSRQMGKSSLRIRTMGKLQAQGIVCAEIELTGIGSQQITAQQWYGGIIQELISGFDLQINRRRWMRDREDLAPVQRLGEFLETVLLTQIHQNIVVFIDEIDSVLGLKFLTDEFFALIRHCYDKRASTPDYKRLTFALLGVATPSDLIQDKNATPFNIGRAIELRGFQFHESAALAEGLVGKVSHPQAVLREILHWTGGQPFLTQKLCNIIAQSCRQESEGVCIIPHGEEPGWVEQFVQKQIVEHWEAHDDPEHLKTIRDRILRNARNSERLLFLYQQILKQGKIAATNSHEQMELRLSGIVTKQDGYLVVYNPIYQSVFNLNWVNALLAILDSESTVSPTTDGEIPGSSIPGNPESTALSPTLTGLPNITESGVIAAIVFTEVASVTNPITTDEKPPPELRERDFRLMRERCQSFAGQVLKSRDKGLLISFASVQKAVSWAIDIQTTLANLTPQESLHHQIGIHLGDVFFSGNDVMGSGVHKAAQLQEQAAPGGIGLSRTVYEAVKGHLGLEEIDVEPRSFNNSLELIPFYHIPPPDRGVLPAEPDEKRWWLVGLRVLIASVMATASILGVRSLGWLESWELQSFDQLMRLRSNEGVDQRLLLIEITEKDVQAQPPEDRLAASLSDRALAQLLTQLEPYQPRAIGLDIYRDRPVGVNYPELAQAMKKSDRFFAICHYGDPGVSPPPEVSPGRQGFNNVVLDSDDVLRRHLLAVSSATPCQSQYSFNWQLAQAYLASEGIESSITPEGYLQLGSTVFKTLDKNTGGYSTINSSGHQILLNYRTTAQIAEKITLTDVLTGQFNPNQIKNRIVLIGTTAPSFNDHRWRTPYSKGQGTVQTITGIEIQAQMVSQILSAVLDQRSLIWWWSEPIEILWICGWSLIGGLLAQTSRSSRGFLVRGGVAIAILYGSGWVLFLQGGWIPLVPAALVLVMSGGVLLVVSRFK
jgi:CHASE2 domain-containing sensor protein